MTTASTTATTATAAESLRTLTDRAELADLLARQGRWLDERRFDETGAIFTEDATVETGGGRAAGLAALTAQARRVHTRSAATHHNTSGVLIEIDGDRATVRANLVVTFVGAATPPEPTATASAPTVPEPIATVGERYRFDAVRTPEGWRFSRLEATPVWQSGRLPRPA